MKKPVILYTTRKCAKCKNLKRWLRRNNLSFTERSLDDTDIMTDLVMRNLVVLSAPALETENKFWLSHEIFDENNRLNPVLKRFLRGDLTE